MSSSVEVIVNDVFLFTTLTQLQVMVIRLLNEFLHASIWGFIHKILHMCFLAEIISRNTKMKYKMSVLYSFVFLI